MAKRDFAVIQARAKRTSSQRDAQQAAELEDVGEKDHHGKVPAEDDQDPQQIISQLVILCLIGDRTGHTSSSSWVMRSRPQSLRT